MKRLRVGIIGVGKLGGFHCNVLSQMPDIDLVGIVDVDINIAEQAAKSYHCRAFDTVGDLLNEVDAVGVIVPTIDHFDIASQAIKAGKAVFIEKPIASTIQEAKDLVDLARQHKVLLQVGHIERFNPAIMALEGYDLAPMFIESHRLAPFDPRGTDVAVVLDLMIHDIDIVLSLVDSNVRRIDANGVAVVSDQIDIANARIQFENGCVANVTASRISQKKMRKMRLFQRDSYVSVDFLQKNTELFKIQNQESSDAPSTVILGQIEKGSQKRHIIYERPTIPEENAMQTEWKYFKDAIENHKEPFVSGQDGLRALEVAVQITQSISDHSFPK
ncbi:gfo/Idh/MocA family oxidoreductase [candidate division KSB1 bacterium]|nr:gfo/Idh/MocA family oxidoreductase [candidate division KSB1 bacterium]